MSAWALETLVATTILLALVLLFRNSVSRAFGPRVAYALWALPALRVVMPSLPGWHLFYVPVVHLSGKPIVAGLVDPISAARIAADDASASPLPLPLSATAQYQTVHWQALLLAVWLGGALMWFGWQMVRYHFFLRRALRSSILLTTTCGIDVLVTELVDGPVAAGVTTRRIFLPADFMTRYTSAERRLALLHEGAHHDRQDIVANLVALAVLALHWWNPLAHRAYKLFRADQELACDATVLADVEGGDRQAYGRAVLKSVSARMPGVACALSHKDELKRRLLTMTAPRIGRRRTWAGAAVAVATVGAGLMVTASGHATAVDPNTYLSPSDIAEIRTAAADARRDGMRAVEDGRRAAEVARRDGMRQRDDALREAARAQEEARVESAHAHTEELVASRAALTAQHVSYRSATENALQVMAIRRSMAARCAAVGKPVSANLNWSRLALCGDTGASIAARADAQIHRQLANDGIE